MSIISLSMTRSVRMSQVSRDQVSPGSDSLHAGNEWSAVAFIGKCHMSVVNVV